MRKIVCAALAAVTLCGCVTTPSEARNAKTIPLEFPTQGKGRSYFYSSQTNAVAGNCLPPRLLAVLGHIRQKTGVRPVLTSGHRSRGRQGSLHRHCLAADIRVPGVKESVVLAAARSAPGIGGVGRYCNGIVHVDVGARREWSHCGGGPFKKRRK
ncbi:DUF882 domain-containing protein [Agrobacterium rubi]|nr:DUF882 domain-containing protein [Agrobacterium rubi]NTF24970.1 DUF882 domain-containing protein [Agrobacterium rubi]